MIAKLIENWDYIVVALLVGIIVTILGVKVWKSKTAQKAEASAKAMTAYVKAAVEKHLHREPEVDPVVEEAVAAVPIAVAPVPVAPVDAFAAAHARLDAAIAALQAEKDAGIAALRVKKDELTTLKANLDKLTAGA